MSDRTKLTLEADLSVNAFAFKLKTALLTGRKSCVVIAPVEPNGFEIAVCWDGRTATVDFSGLQHDFDVLDDAIAWSARAASRDYQLRVDLIGERAYQWTLENAAASDGQHQPLRGGRPILFAAWRSTRTVYKQNDHILLTGLMLHPAMSPPLMMAPSDEGTPLS
jgi:hypothetical protein